MLRREMQIILLGMHRSGTSAVGGFLQQAGFYFGPPEQAYDLHPTNPKGFFERRDVVHIDDRILAAAGANWIMTQTLPPDFAGVFAPPELGEEARAVADDLCARPASFVKDPRMCLTLPFWQPFFRQPLYVILHRNPLAVAASLERRGDAPRAVGLALWERYNADILRHTAGQPRFAMSFEEFMGDPAHAVARLFEQLRAFAHLPVPTPPPATAETWFDRSIVHHRNDERALAAHAPEPLLTLYRRLNAPDGLDTASATLSDSSHRLLSDFHSARLQAQNTRDITRFSALRSLASDHHQRDELAAARRELNALLNSGRWRVPSALLNHLGKPVDPDRHGFSPEILTRRLDRLAVESEHAWSINRRRLQDLLHAAPLFPQGEASGDASVEQVFAPPLLVVHGGNASGGGHALLRWLCLRLMNQGHRIDLVTPCGTSAWLAHDGLPCIEYILAAPADPSDPAWQQTLADVVQRGRAVILAPGVRQSPAGAALADALAAAASTAGLPVFDHLAAREDLAFAPDPLPAPAPRFDLLLAVEPSRSGAPVATWATALRAALPGRTLAYLDLAAPGTPTSATPEGWIVRPQPQDPVWSEARVVLTDTPALAAAAEAAGRPALAVDAARPLPLDSLLALIEDATSGQAIALAHRMNGRAPARRAVDTLAAALAALALPPVGVSES
jgi:hypothetical protein